MSLLWDFRFIAVFLVFSPNFGLERSPMGKCPNLSCFCFPRVGYIVKVGFSRLYSVWNRNWLDLPSRFPIIVTASSNRGAFGLHSWKRIVVTFLYISYIQHVCCCRQRKSEHIQSFEKLAQQAYCEIHVFLKKNVLPIEINVYLLSEADLFCHGTLIVWSIYCKKLLSWF